MDALINPYAPGAGTTPSALIGRDIVIEDVRIALSRLKDGRHHKSFILVGLRGVGKTVLLRHLEELSEQYGHKTIWIEASENRLLQDSLVPMLKIMLEKMSSNVLSETIKYAFDRLSKFAAQVKFSYEGASIQFLETKSQSIEIDFENELYALLDAVSDVAKEQNVALTIHIDEMQFLPKEQLEAFYKSLHLLGQKRKPIMLLGAGLPQIRAQSGNARSYAERLISFKEIDSLSREDSEKVLAIPAQELGVSFNKDAMDLVLDHAKGYPYFLQQFGSDLWKYAQNNPVTVKEAEASLLISQKKLDEGFNNIRLERSTPSEKKYLRAMAELGEGPYRSGDIANKLRKEPNQLSLTRNNLIKKGAIYSPSHGDTAFTVPLFDKFLKRVIPNFEP